MRTHATEDVHDPQKTLCGAAVTKVHVNNHDPDCGRCIRVIRSRCFDHNVARCKVCPPGWYVLGGNRAP